MSGDSASQSPNKRRRKVGSDEKDMFEPAIPCTPGEPLNATPMQIRRMLQVVEDEILPKTEKGVAAGNKVFGAAVLDGRSFDKPSEDAESCLPTIIAETNHETLCPIWHGEVYTIKQWAETVPAKDRPAPSESVFFSTHEPCCMCISSVVWAGFKKVFYLFPYETTRDQGIPHDINIMQELWQVPRYATCNKFCSSAGLIDLVDTCPQVYRDEFKSTIARITERYNKLADKYHSEKGDNPKNTMSFN